LPVENDGMTTVHPARRVLQRLLDYYLICPRSPHDDDSPEGIVVEEFVLGEDYSAIRLHSIGWSSNDRHWRKSAALSRAIRVDGNLRGRVRAIARDEAEVIYRRLGGGELPDEKALRTKFGDGEALPASAPLRLSRGQVPAGFHGTRLYRILFANELGPEGLANLAAAWRMTVTADIADPLARVIGTAHLRIGDDAFGWDLRRIGAGAAWGLDVTVNLAGSGDHTIGPLLRELTCVMREQGLIPVTIERFS
jgi:hypothetical protein